MLAAVALAASTPLPAGAADPPPPPCRAPEHRQFDFWLGHWDVFLPDGTRAGENLIEAVLDGCVLRESWQGRGGLNGTSLNAYDTSDQRWHQTWVDNRGGRLELAGALRDRSMVLVSGAPGEGTQQRITWTPQADGSVRQLWESSTDGGKSWTVAFDGRYVRKPRTATK
jgi:hypothetical protein